jgi:hypothetical protein
MALKAYGSILNLLEEWGLIKRPNMVKAILCSYYRCTEGCFFSKNVDDLSWDEIDPDTGKTKTVKCVEFCNPPTPSNNKCGPNDCYSCLDCEACIDAGCSWCTTINQCLPSNQNLPRSGTPNVPFYCLTKEEDKCPPTFTPTGYTDDTKGTICGAQTLQYPVVITLNNSEKISSSHFQEIGAKLSFNELDLPSFATKIISYLLSTTGAGIWDLITQENCIFFMDTGKKYVKYSKETSAKCFGIFKCYEELEVKEGTYSIYTGVFLGDKSTYVQPLSK